MRPAINIVVLHDGKLLVRVVPQADTTERILAMILAARNVPERIREYVPFRLHQARVAHGVVQTTGYAGIGE